MALVYLVIVGAAQNNLRGPVPPCLNISGGIEFNVTKR